MQNTLGSRIKKIISEKKIKSIRQLALAVDIDPSYMTKVTKDEAGLTFETLEKISSLYDVDLNWLRGLDDNPQGMKENTNKEVAQKPDQLTITTLNNLAESNKLLAMTAYEDSKTRLITAETQKKIVESNADLIAITKATVSAAEENPLKDIVVLKSVLEIIAEVGAGKGWKSKQDGLVELNKRVYGNLRKNESVDTLTGSGK